MQEFGIILHYDHFLYRDQFVRLGPVHQNGISVPLLVELHEFVLLEKLICLRSQELLLFLLPLHQVLRMLRVLNVLLVDYFTFKNRILLRLDPAF